jgi:hypothetical protein
VTTPDTLRRAGEVLQALSDKASVTTIVDAAITRVAPGTVELGRRPTISAGPDVTATSASSACGRSQPNPERAATCRSGKTAVPQPAERPHRWKPDAGHVPVHRQTDPPGRHRRPAARRTIASAP